MPRPPRQISKSGYYHVVLRGIGRQLLFESTEERQDFLRILARTRDKFGCVIIAWCLMGNHVHLLLKVADGNLSRAVASISISFAMHHNARTEHVGHVFQNRFSSKPIESDGQLLACVRYIHDNPAKAGICAPSEYTWSSYGEYVGAPSPIGVPIVDTTLILGMVDGETGFEQLSSSNMEAYREPRGMAKLTDAEAKRVFEEDLSAESRAALFGGTKRTRDAALRELKNYGLTGKQIERLTGIGRNVIQRA
jgi:REP element-mobilizing transposase RayT